ncbi:hypothetical protein WJX79_008176 [Trebouxia sp. C0005]
MSEKGGQKRRQEGGGGGAAGKKSKYFQANSKATLPVGSRGVLVSCIGGKEQYAAKDSIRILTEYYERLKGSADPAAPDTSAKPADISSAIADEVAELQSNKGKLFVYHRVNVFGLIYIGFQTPDVHPTPSEVVQAAAQDVLKTKQCLSKVCMRFMPIEGVCYAGLEDISKLGKKVLAEHFPTGEDVSQTTFGVLYEHRASDLLKRMDVINTMVDCVPQPPYKVELNNPKKTILPNDGAAPSSSSPVPSADRPAQEPPAPHPTNKGKPKKEYRQIQMPTPEQIVQEDMMNNCGIRTVMSGVMGMGLGLVFGVVMGSMDAGGAGMDGNLAPGVEAQKQTTRQVFRQMLLTARSRSWTYAKGFGAVGALFAGSECVIEKMRAKHDIYNSMYAGCFAGGTLAASAGPKAACAGCLTFGAFSAIIDKFLEQP